MDYYRGAFGDAHVINIWRNQENIYTIGGLIEANDMKVYYDCVDEIIYVVFVSETEVREGSEVEVYSHICVVTIEDPLGGAVCNTFRQLVPLQ